MFAGLEVSRGWIASRINTKRQRYLFGVVSMIRSRRMYHKKICVLGARAVGKTSLARRFREGGFNPDYKATYGAAISKIQLQVDADRLQLMLWDIEGLEPSSQRFFDYLKGASAIVYVVDGTRLQTLEAVLELRQKIEQRAGVPVRSIVLFNKSDLIESWEISPGTISDIEADGILALLTSAREGTGVNTAFNLLARVLLGKSTLVAA